MQDKVLVCERCQNEFVWSKEEQVLYEKRGLEQPKYCPICRGIKTAEEDFYKRKR